MASQPQVLIDNEYATLWYHPDEKIVHHKFHKFISGEPFRQVLLTGLEAFRTHGAQKWLSDDRGNAVVQLEDADWSQTGWTPHVIAAGWKHWAVVMPENVIGKMNMRRWVETYANMGVTVQVFSDPDAAFEWLKAQ